ncbi:hypothetical protein Tcan_18725 [Toxocara canis]|uniref:Uncharacterized protein n=1 Tax=Toxocara canis TaxID=6265 RepID=A0A0B2VX89_TOXCA|nr:hypothetical protein Tcan_18725 [Toxocara canis]
MSHPLYSEIVAQPTVQYFLAALCDLEVNPEDRMRLGLRYANTPQVQRLLVKLRKERCAAYELSMVDPNVIVTALKGTVKQSVIVTLQLNTTVGIECTSAQNDALLLFTPALFPNSVGDVSRFLRATRICLVLIDLCDFVFRPFLAISSTSNANDEEFFRDIVCRLSRLHEWLDWRDESEEVCEVDCDVDLSDSFVDKFPNNCRYYQITYIFD